MSKALEALKKVKMDMDYHRKYECHYYYPKEEREEYFSIIETALKDYEKLINNNVRFTSKYDVEKLVEDYGKLKDEYNRLEGIYNHFIKQYNLLMKDYSKMLKAIGMLKEKMIDAGWLISCENIEQYNNVIGTATHKLLTQEEFDLLKEILL